MIGPTLGQNGPVRRNGSPTAQNATEIGQFQAGGGAKKKDSSGLHDKSP
jgi:hypothetical protein